jgi:septal ring factor EnvC (AmiA/AmiB activator)
MTMAARLPKDPRAQLERLLERHQRALTTLRANESEARTALLEAEAAVVTKRAEIAALQKAVAALGGPEPPLFAHEHQPEPEPALPEA